MRAREKEGGGENARINSFWFAIYDEFLVSVQYGRHTYMTLVTNILLHSSSNCTATASNPQAHSAATVLSSKSRRT
jgi:hypothetical protein